MAIFQIDVGPLPHGMSPLLDLFGPREMSGFKSVMCAKAEVRRRRQIYELTP